MRHKISFLFMFILLGLCGYLLYASYREVKADAIRELNTRQLIHAKQAAKEIEGFFKRWVDRLTYLAADESIITLNDAGKKQLALFLAAHKGQITGVTRVDAKGRIIYTVPYVKKSIGADISYQKHIKEIMGAHKPVVSDVISAVQGFDTIALHVPVFRGDKCDGTIGVLIDFQTLAKSALEDIKIGKTGYAWMVSRDGTELYCPVPGHTGRPVFETCKDFPTIIVMAKEMLKGNQGVTTYYFDMIMEKSVKTVKKHAVYIPIKIENTFWSIVVASSEDEVLTSLVHFRNRLLAITGALLLGALFFSYYGMKARGIVQEEIKRKAAEGELRRFKFMVENAKQEVYLMKPDGQLVYVNHAAGDSLGYAVEEMYAIGIKGFDGPFESIFPQYFEDLKNRDVPPFGTSHRSKDGQEVLKEIKLFYLRIDEDEYMCGFGIDITERKKAEEKLHESERRLADIINFLPVATLAIDIDGKVIAWNKAIEEMTGVPAEMMLGKDDYEYAIPFYGKRRPILINFVTMWSKDIERQYSFIKKEGDTLFTETSVPFVRGQSRILAGKASPLYDSQGNTVGAIESISDVTERKEAEEALFNEKEKFLTVLENAPFGIVLIGKNGHFLYINPKYREIFGYDSVDIPDGKTWFRKAYPDNAYRHDVISTWLCDLNNAFVGERQPVVFSVTCKDGSRKMINFIPVFLSNGDSLMVCEDITERRRAEEELRLAEEKYRNIFENAVMGIFQTTPDGHYLNVNHALARMFGYESPEELINTISDVNRQIYVDPHRRTELIGLIETEGTIINFEAEMHRKDGTKLCALMTARAVRDDSGKTLYYEGTTEDITARKRLEAQLQSAQKMEAIGTLAGGIAHDFNNILMGIQGYASLMMLEIDPVHPHYDQLQHIEEQVSKAANLTKQLLGFARGGKYEVKPLDLNEVIEKTSTMFGRTKKEINIHCKYEKELWVVEVDQGQIEQVFLNLYLNAWQAMPGGGELVLETKNVILDEKNARFYTAPPGKYVQSSITDTGEGMDTKTKERIFEPFFTTKEFGRGTGLGLAMVYGIVTSHHGFIHVISEPRHGTTFLLFLPASDKKAVESKPSAPEVIRGIEKILLVDDEPSVLKVSKAILETLGYRVYGAKNGEDAVELYKEKKDEIDLVILDMIMPGLSGGETFDCIKMLNASAKVMLSSGYSLDKQAQNIMEKGCNGFIQKPFNIADLSRKIRDVLDS
jgi:two-component system cell cycle sensor histidine kinase/response regulator CckA